MATPPTVLAGEPVPPPSSPTSPVVAGAPVPAKFPVAPLLMAVLAGLVIAALMVGGGAYWLLRSGRIPLQGATAAKADEAVPVATHLVALDPLVVNLADGDGSAYLRVTMALRVADVASKKSAGGADEKAGGESGSASLAAVRDTALMVLGQQTSAELLAVGGKERLKSQLKIAFAGHDPDLKVVDVFFTDFLVQR